MGILKKVLGNNSETNADAGPDVPEVHEAMCPHTALAPHWDKPGDMGKPELATYTCESCGEKFAYTEAQQLLNRLPAVLANVGTADEDNR